MPLSELNRRNLKNAVECSSNYRPIIFCSSSMTAIGMLLMVVGTIVILIDHVEFGPPQYDREYERYVGSSLAHIIGPMFIAFGSLVVLGSITVMAYATKTYFRNCSGGGDFNKATNRPQELYG